MILRTVMMSKMVMLTVRQDDHTDADVKAFRS